MNDIELDYEYLGQKALRQVVVDVLAITADLGTAPGAHHFYIEFLTGFDGVVIPDHLRSAYPERMTIVLQHQFENLTVSPDRFSVTLWFRGKQADLVIPFEAITSFADPSAEFGLRFDPGGEPTSGAAAPPPREPEPDAEPGADAEDSPSGRRPQDGKADSAAVVSLDAFRKK